MVVQLAVRQCRLQQPRRLRRLWLHRMDLVSGRRHVDVYRLPPRCRAPVDVKSAGPRLGRVHTCRPDRPGYVLSDSG